MKKNVLKLVLLYYVLFCSQAALETSKSKNLPEGSKCSYDKYNGTCTKDYECVSLLHIRNESKIYNEDIMCSYEENTPIVCCTDCPGPKVVDDLRTVTYVQPVGLVPRTGEKSLDKCIDYLKRYVNYECHWHSSYYHDFFWSDKLKCTYNVSSAVLPAGGTDAVRGEFPHMVLLGYGEDRESVEWQCGGSLISERFILTAAHCISSPKLGPVRFIAMGILKRSDSPDLWHWYRVKKIIPYPAYSAPSKYHDIALIQTERPVQFENEVLPACIHASGKDNLNKLSATGWGGLGRGLPVADTLQKVTLERFSDQECSNIYQEHRHLRRGYDSYTQMCYGSHEAIKDTCGGDSGGPLQDKVISGCMFRIIGLTSSGLPCGYRGGAGLYTKVEPYIPWIESIVWP